MSDTTLFTNASLDEAKRSAGEKRFVLAVFSAKWCAPCHAMESTAWRDPAVRAWVEANASAVKIDIDDEEALAARFNVRAVPTILLMRGEQVIDRIVGARDAAGVLRWFEDVAAGRTEGDRLRAAAGSTDVEARYNLARHALATGDCATATEELAWIWENALAYVPAFVGVRHSFLVRDISSLVSADTAARSRFEQLRDAAGARLAAASRDDLAPLRDWVSLNQALGEEDRTVEWFLANASKLPESTRHRLPPRMLEVLRERALWRDLADLHPHPIEDVRRAAKIRAQLLESGAESKGAERTAREQAANSIFRNEICSLVTALRAAERTAEADEVIREATQVDDSSELRSAIEAAWPEKYAR